MASAFWRCWLMNVALRRNPPVGLLAQPQGSVSPQLSFVCSTVNWIGAAVGTEVGVGSGVEVGAAVGGTLGDGSTDWARVEAGWPASGVAAPQPAAIRVRISRPAIHHFEGFKSTCYLLWKSSSHKVGMSV